MSFKADLYVDDQKYKILTGEYELSQSIDHKNKPISRAKGGIINVMVETSQKDATKDYFLFNWMSSDTQVMDGHIEFIKPNSMAGAQKTVFYQCSLH